MSNKVKCDFFHDTDGECCTDRESCRFARQDFGIETPAPLHEGMTMKQFLIFLGFSALIFVFALAALSEYNSRYSILVTHDDPRSIR